MSSPTSLQPSTYQNPPTVTAVNISNNNDAPPLTETGLVSKASSNPRPAAEVEAKGLTIAPSMAIIRISSESFILKGGALKRNANTTKNEVWQFFQVYNKKKLTHSNSNLKKHIQQHHNKKCASIMNDKITWRKQY